MNTKKIIIALCLIAAFGLIVYFWQQSKQDSVSTKPEKTGSQQTQKSAADYPPAAVENVNPSYAQTPTEAYKMLYEAVKARDTEAIKSMMSKKTLAFAQGVSAQQKKDVSQVYENGFTATTFSPTLPKIRDERTKDDMGAVEVWSEKDKRWEDLPFVKEDGGWKLAIGDIFAGSYKSPGKGQAQIEAESSNTNKPIPYTEMTNANKSIPVTPKSPEKREKPKN